MEFRELTASDNDAAAAVWEEAGLTRPWNDPGSDFDRAVRGPASAVLGAFDEHGLAATVMVGHDGHRGWVYYLAVKQTKRHGGLGRRMMQEAEAWVRERGVAKLQLMVRQDNTEALGFYERLGYEDAKVTVLARWLR
jgi:ribosomal protein S18 acetylase RimI-like enzyme